MITSHEPSDWRDLQVQVAKILRECGLTAEVEKQILTVRGTAVIDVLAEEVRNGRTTSILCECKRWSSRVPQTVVHSFRTLVVDSGANVGYIVSSKGFQVGAYKAAERTNVQLVTWSQFQDVFEADWIDNHFVPRAVALLEPLVQMRRYARQRRDSDSGPAAHQVQHLVETDRYLFDFAAEYLPRVRSREKVTFPTLPLDGGGSLFFDVYGSGDTVYDIRASAGYREFLSALESTIIRVVPFANDLSNWMLHMMRYDNGYWGGY